MARPVDADTGGPQTTGRPFEDDAGAPLPRLPELPRPTWLPAIPDRPWLPPSWGDVLIVVLVAFTAMVNAVGFLRHPGERAVPMELAILFAPVLALGVRRRFPVGVFAFAIASVVLEALVGGSAVGSLPVFICIYTIGTIRPWPVTAAAWLAAVAVGIAWTSGTPQDVTGAVRFAGELVGTAILYGLAAALGLYFGTRRAYVNALLDRNRRLRLERRLVARQAVADERVRIARELHDVVAHHVSVMVIQAGAAEAVLPPGFEPAAAALESIRTTGREALAEMRRMLDVLRAQAPNATESGDDRLGPVDASAADPISRAPQPGLQDLDGLLARMREAGLDVELRREGVARPLPASINLSAFRIVQEALTNALRHGGSPLHASVTLSFEPATLQVTIVDDGRGAGPGLATPAPNTRRANQTAQRANGLDPTSTATDQTPGGHGLVGMRERVALFGGELVAEPGPAGGFRVVARFPIAEATP